MRHPIPSITFFQNMPTSRFIDKEGVCGEPLDNCNGHSSSPSFKVGGVSIVLIMIILYCMRHPFEMVQHKERKSTDLDVYFPPKEWFFFPRSNWGRYYFSRDMCLRRDIIQGNDAVSKKVLDKQPTCRLSSHPIPGGFPRAFL